MKISLIVLVLFSLSGCVAGFNLKPPEMMPKDAQTKFTFDYKISGVSKSQLWRRARDHFAGAYGDSRSVFRVMDEKDGTIIGKGASPWPFVVPDLVSWVCHSAYHIRFAAKDGKARLQLEIINGAPPASKCQGFPLPTLEGYDEVKRSFISSSKALKKALEGKGSFSDLQDF